MCVDITQVSTQPNMNTEPEEDAYLRRMNDLNNRYLAVEAKVMSYDLNRLTIQAWTVIKEQYSFGELVDTAGSNYDLFRKLGREVRNLEHQQELAVSPYPLTNLNYIS